LLAGRRLKLLCSARCANLPAGCTEEEYEFDIRGERNVEGLHGRICDRSCAICEKTSKLSFNDGMSCANIGYANVGYANVLLRLRRYVVLCDPGGARMCLCEEENVNRDGSLIMDAVVKFGLRFPTQIHQTNAGRTDDKFWRDGHAARDGDTFPAINSAVYGPGGMKISTVNTPAQFCLSKEEHGQGLSWIFIVYLGTYIGKDRTCPDGIGLCSCPPFGDPSRCT
jgi:hypothetical protein